MVLAEQPLVGEVVRVALVDRGLDAVGVPWASEPFVLVRRRIVGLEPRAGLIVGDLTTVGRRNRAAAVVARTRVPWLLLVVDPDGIEWGGLLTAGVAGIRSTSISVEDLVAALRQMMGGAEMMPRMDRAERIRAWARVEEQLRATVAHLTELSPRELAVLAQLYDGLTVGVIAEAGGVSAGTVRSQVKAVLRKLEVSSQLAAVAAFGQVHSRVEVPREDRRRRQ